MSSVVFLMHDSFSAFGAFCQGGKISAARVPDNARVSLLASSPSYFLGIWQV
jgi:hypothetical protein